ncbi:hypothetical protein ABZ299_24040 [Streptomyces sp. NPDC006184]|uniref:hypothetical protein n=1 Tax=Streptomyces sp. NPDC006184 TaxID=3155455 RepID=UPI0033B1925C
MVRPELGAFYVVPRRRGDRRAPPGVFPAGLAEAVLAALALPAPDSPHVPDAAEFVGRAWSGLLHFVWRTGADLPAVLDHVRGVVEPLTRPATTLPPAGAPATPAPSAVGPAGDRAAGDAGGEEELPTGTAAAGGWRLADGGAAAGRGGRRRNR